MNAQRQPMPLMASAVSPDPPFAQTVLRAVTLRKLAAAYALALTLALVRSLRGLGASSLPHGLGSQIIMALMGATSILLAALAADEAIRRGWRASRAVPLALVLAASVAAISQWYVRDWLGLTALEPDEGMPLVLIVEAGIDICAFGGLAMMAYLQRQDARRLVEGVRILELTRLNVEHDLMESRLAAAQAQLDPEAILKRLSSIRDRYREGHPDAAQDLEALIQLLTANATRCDPDRLHPSRS